MPESLREYHDRRMREILSDTEEQKKVIGVFKREVRLEGLTPEERVMGLTSEQLEELAAKARKQQSPPESA